MDGWINTIVESMFCYIGQTVTIFTTSGGLSGSGFTGVLLSVDCNVVRLLADVGAGPACPVGSSCTNIQTPYGMAGGYGYDGCGCGGGIPFEGNPLGAVCVIPTRAIACFTHNAI